MHKRAFPALKTFALLPLVCLSAFSLSARQSAYQQVDDFARSFHEPFSDPSDLARKLTRPFPAQRDQARVLYTWLATHIEYDMVRFNAPSVTRQFSGRTDREVEAKIKAWHDKETRAAWLAKKGICGDFSRLMEQMCAAAGLECMVVQGLSRATSGGAADNHIWNAVKFDGQWHLVDATWAAGYIESDRFVANFSGAFFDTSPELFALSHLPDQARWQLLAQPVSKAAFDKQPYVNIWNAHFPVTACAPAGGKIVPAGGKAEIRLRFDAIPKVLVLRTAGNKPVPSELTSAEDGWVSLRFAPAGASEIKVLAGETPYAMYMLAKFAVE